MKVALLLAAAVKARWQSSLSAWSAAAVSLPPVVANAERFSQPAIVAATALIGPKQPFGTHALQQQNAPLPERGFPASPELIAHAGSWRPPAFLRRRRR